ncbi:MAG: metal-dependent phosphohydrolase [Micrococcales bacterium]|uniref:HD-GYP domain-containing protein n=1 Tax=Phycicoccus sp. TaxID=1902410 RepID=UPI0019C3752B|nr:HD domain-containing phosphohydrolase [Phycicoccus sp.]MBD3781418.1 metal-dependent phosphohydrolase [Micrococcales bacterium]HMM95451.1 metal-dependent phosphohydrolase [Phycicoccus sp.]
MTPILRRPGRLAAGAVLAVGALSVLRGLLTSGGDLPTLLATHGHTLLVVVGFVAVGELARIRMPSGRETAPLSSASAMSAVFLGQIAGEPTLDIDSGLVVLVVTFGLVLAAAARRSRHRATGTPELAARVVGVSVAAVIARDWGSPTLWELQGLPSASPGVVVLGMGLAAAVGLVTELVLVAALRAERQQTPWSAAVRDEVGEAAPLTLAVLVTGPMVALLAPVLGLLSLPVALVPLALAYTAVRQYIRNRETNRQLIATLSHLTEHGGYTPEHHAERVAQLSVRVGRVLGLGERALRDLEYAALLHDLGQISLLDPIPDGATVLAAPADQRAIAQEGGRIIRRAEIFDDVAAYVEGQTTPYRMVRELGEEVPMAARIIKCANAFDDLSGGTSDPGRVSAAMERIHLGLGYEYDPDVVDALTRVVEDGSVGRVGDRPLVAR